MNKQMVAVLVLSFLAQTTSLAKHIQHEMANLQWATEKGIGIPYSIDPEGMGHSFSNDYVDKYDNLYFAFFSKDFRKYDSTGKLIYAKDIYVDEFVVDDSSNVYFTQFDHNQTAKVIDMNGNLSDRTYQIVHAGTPQNIQWLKNISGNVYLGFRNITMRISGNSLVAANNIYYKPFTSNGIYFDSETGMRKINRLNATSYNKDFVNIYEFNYSGGAFEWLDTLKLHICSGMHQAAELLQIDNTDNYYIWIFYGFEEGTELVVLNRDFQELERLEFPINLESMGIFIIRPFIKRDGTIYEFRARKDGLHVIRWTREE
jgi:hypothetical protein